MPTSMMVRAYSGHNWDGINKWYTMPDNARYRGVPVTQLIDDALYPVVKSAKIFRNSHGDSDLIVFVWGSLSGMDWASYRGTCIRYKHPRNSPDFVRDQYIGNLNVESMLLVNTNKGPEHRISLASSALPLPDGPQTIVVFAAQIIDGMLPSLAERDGPPAFGCELFPFGISHLSSNRVYVRMHQKLKIKLAKTYNATFTYHLRLWINAAGRPRVSGSRWAYWIESGACAKEIEKELKPSVVSGLGDLVSLAQGILDTLAGPANLADIYLLPGNDTLGGALMFGDTRQDVTIVMQFA